MRSIAALQLVAAAWLLLTSASAPAVDTAEPGDAAIVDADQPAPKVAPPPKALVGDFLADGVVIVISKASQQMFVFQDGALWRTSPVSTGRRGHTTPSGVFAILQKQVYHRSNLYANAPMPYMQRLTWSGIAIHAGHLPGYPASHGCIRLPREFARALYKRTSMSSTAVIVVDEALAADHDALRVANLSDAAVPISPSLLRSRQTRLASAGARRSIATRQPRLQYAQVLQVPAPARARDRGLQTIQLAAATSRGEASAHWQRLLSTRPDLSGMQMAIVPAMVNARQYYRLRLSAPDAHSVCRNLKRSGIDCFPVS